jgi:hypothetical protein
LCAHRLEVAIATASEKFIDRFAVVLDEDRFAAALDEDCFAVVSDKVADALDSMSLAGRELDAR